jgi:hypothetical protein
VMSALINCFDLYNMECMANICRAVVAHRDAPSTFQERLAVLRERLMGLSSPSPKTQTKVEFSRLSTIRIGMVIPLRGRYRHRCNLLSVLTLDRS